jgi:adenylyl-sulfate kinase
MRQPTMNAQSISFIPCLLWLTGLSGAGKSTTANQLKIKFNELDIPHYLLDGDSLRQGLCRDLGFTDADRAESCRRMAEVAKLFMDAGMIVICASISPHQLLRDQLRAGFAEQQFIEVFVDAPLRVCEARDPKGLYKKARAGEIALFTGVDSTYEKPQHPEIHLSTDADSVAISIEKIMHYLTERGLITK